MGKRALDHAADTTVVRSPQPTGKKGRKAMEDAAGGAAAAIETLANLLYELTAGLVIGPVPEIEPRILAGSCLKSTLCC